MHKGKACRPIDKAIFSLSAVQAYIHAPARIINRKNAYPYASQVILIRHSLHPDAAQPAGRW